MITFKHRLQTTGSLNRVIQNHIVLSTLRVFGEEEFEERRTLGKKKRSLCMFGLGEWRCQCRDEESEDIFINCH